MQVYLIHALGHSPKLSTLVSSPLLIAILELAAGCIVLIWAADRLVAGASSLSRRWGISPLIIGIGVIGFGTSAPEMLVSVMAALRGNPGLAVGNALGSNIANVGLILGLTAVIYPLSVARITFRRDLPVLFGVMTLTTVLMLDLFLGRIEAIVLLAGLVMVMVFLTRPVLMREIMAETVTTPAHPPPADAMSKRIAMIWTLTGLLLLPISAQILVNGAIGMATLVGVSDVVIGLTIVALGTSLPELAAAAASAIRREDDLTIGNILGSNLFNLLGVLGIAALITPMAIEPILLRRDIGAMFIITAALLVLAWRRSGPGQINRVAGGLLLGGYLLYQGLVIGQSLSS